MRTKVLFLAAALVSAVMLSSCDNTPTYKTAVHYQCYLISTGISVETEKTSDWPVLKACADSVYNTLNSFTDSMVVSVSYRADRPVNYGEADDYVLQQWKDKEAEAVALVAKKNLDMASSYFTEGSFSINDITMRITRREFGVNLKVTELGNITYTYPRN